MAENINIAVNIKNEEAKSKLAEVANSVQKVEGSLRNVSMESRVMDKELKKSKDSADQLSDGFKKVGAIVTGVFSIETVRRFFTEAIRMQKELAAEMEKRTTDAAQTLAATGLIGVPGMAGNYSATLRGIARDTHMNPEQANALFRTISGVRPGAGVADSNMEILKELANVSENFDAQTQQFLAKRVAEMEAEDPSADASGIRRNISRAYRMKSMLGDDTGAIDEALKYISQSASLGSGKDAPEIRNTVMAMAMAAGSAEQSMRFLNPLLTAAGEQRDPLRFLQDAASGRLSQGRLRRAGLDDQSIRILGLVQGGYAEAYRAATDDTDITGEVRGAMRDALGSVAGIRDAQSETDYYEEFVRKQALSLEERKLKFAALQARTGIRSDLKRGWYTPQFPDQTFGLGVAAGGSDSIGDSIRRDLEQRETRVQVEVRTDPDIDVQSSVGLGSN